MIGGNLLANKVDTSFVPLISHDWFSSMAVLSILLLLVNLVLDISSLVDNIRSMIEKSWKIKCVAIASLPRRPTANVAEVVAANAGHVVAAVCELDHSVASLTSLPSLLTGSLDKLLESNILRTVAVVRGAFTKRASRLAASPTSSNVSDDSVWRDECTTSKIVTVRSVHGAELHIPSLEDLCNFPTDQAFRVSY